MTSKAAQERDRDITGAVLIETFSHGAAKRIASALVYPPAPPEPGMWWEKSSVSASTSGDILVTWRCVRREFPGEVCASCGAKLGTAHGAGHTVICRCGRRHVSYLDEAHRLFRLMPKDSSDG